MKHQILISVGSNIDKENNTLSGLDALYQCFGPINTSTIYESESVGFDGNNFYNLVVEAFSEKSVAQVCQHLKNIEDQHGRIREKKFGNRTLDLDLLTYDQLVSREPVVLPREEILFNAFVLKPMAEIVPDQIHPIVKQTYASLWQHYSLQTNNRQRLWSTGLQWSAKH